MSWVSNRNHSFSEVCLCLGCLSQLSFHLAQATKSTWRKNTSYLACSTRRRANISEQWWSAGSENGCLVWVAVFSCSDTFRLSVHSAREATCPKPERNQSFKATWCNLPFHMEDFSIWTELFLRWFSQMEMLLNVDIFHIILKQVMRCGRG